MCQQVETLHEPLVCFSCRRMALGQRPRLCGRTRDRHSPTQSGDHCRKEEPRPGGQSYSRLSVVRQAGEGDARQFQHSRPGAGRVSSGRLAGRSTHARRCRFDHGHFGRSRWRLVLGGVASGVARARRLSRAADETRLRPGYVPFLNFRAGQVCRPDSRLERRLL